jgi:hypothetical protein
MALLSNMSEKLKPASSSEIQVKNQRKTVSIEEKLVIVNQFKKVNKLFPYALTLDSLIVAYIQCVIMLVGLKESSKSGTEVFVWQDCHSPIGMNHAKNCG